MATKWTPTSFDKLPPLVYEILCHGIVTNKLLEAKEVKAAAAKMEESGDAQQHDGNGEVNIEAIRDEWDDIHVSHDLQDTPQGLKECGNLFICFVAAAHLMRMQHDAISHLCVWGLLQAKLLGDVCVHVDEAQEVEAERRCQTTQQPMRKKEIATHIRVHKCYSE